MLKRLWRWWRRKTNPRTLGHVWRDDRFGVRVCTRCGVNNYLMENRFPDIGEAKYHWQEIWDVCDPSNSPWVEAERARLVEEGEIG